MKLTKRKLRYLIREYLNNDLRHQEKSSYGVDDTSLLDPTKFEYS